MAKPRPSPSRRDAALSREQIVDAAIVLLDRDGEAGLTFRALSERLATGPGALYGHIADKRDLLTAACDAVIARSLPSAPAGATPQAAIRTLALAMFDAIDAHPWIGSALWQAPGQLPIVRIIEALGQPLRALGVADTAQWAAVSALLNYMLGVSGQNAANTQLALTQGLVRDETLAAMASTWSRLDPVAYPFVRSMAGALQTHDDRLDFLAGIDLILAGILAQGDALATGDVRKRRRS
ncbi:AcrR family transcriptional regulator [Xanthomonas sacchari]|uniref:TetR/AcrR family transcriptional regulator n=1 Tax=unclassified Xanthomonas TaxID=2643310 RepID=UPI00136B4062|nr:MULTISPECIES: TetR family transcriptional regulator [unclassified Xanthomonas]MBB6365198.1 AcrR family transcriptional regulator [Xanthomonas sp. F10]MXV32470.1 TetR family transcriptional regulator [Xanthomonas sp. LMG 8989]